MSWGGGGGVVGVGDVESVAWELVKLAVPSVSQLSPVHSLVSKVTQIHSIVPDDDSIVIGHSHNRRLLEIDKHYSLELCFSIEKHSTMHLQHQNGGWPTARAHLLGSVLTIRAFRSSSVFDVP